MADKIRYHFKRAEKKYLKRWTMVEHVGIGKI